MSDYLDVYCSSDNCNIWRDHFAQVLELGDSGWYQVGEFHEVPTPVAILMDPGPFGRLIRHNDPKGNGPIADGSVTRLVHDLIMHQQLGRVGR